MHCHLMGCRPERCRTGPTRAASLDTGTEVNIPSRMGCADYSDNRLPLILELPVGLAPAVPNCAPLATKCQRTFGFDLQSGPGAGTLLAG
jgi:hypothetical protein